MVVIHDYDQLADILMRTGIVGGFGTQISGVVLAIKGEKHEIRMELHRIE